MMTNRQRQSGAVSIFIVIFASLLMVVITMSFVQLMLKDQQQATANDLSQSALDSAQAGVEDAKRLLLLQQSCSNGTVPGGFASRCGDVTTAINSGKCNTVAAIFGTPSDKETIVEQSANDTSLQQAYTCVKFLQAFDYRGQLAKDEAAIIPLTAASSFNTVKISWFSKDDVASTSAALTFPSTGADVTLPRVGAAWPATAPSLMRAQFVQTGARFTLPDFDTKQGSGESDANTVFLYPLKNLGLSSLSDISNVDARRVAGGSPQGIRCSATFSAEFACSVSIALPTYDGAVTSRNAFLRLGSLYNGAHYSVELFNGATAVAFDGAQSIIDSTGRANDMFRRVITRVHLAGNFTYPEAAIDTKNNICKDFSITDNVADYDAGSCDPTKTN